MATRPVFIRGDPARVRESAAVPGTDSERQGGSERIGESLASGNGGAGAVPTAAHPNPAEIGVVAKRKKSTSHTSTLSKRKRVGYPIEGPMPDEITSAQPSEELLGATQEWPFLPRDGIDQRALDEINTLLASFNNEALSVVTEEHYTELMRELEARKKLSAEQCAAIRQVLADPRLENREAALVGEPSSAGAPIREVPKEVFSRSAMVRLGQPPHSPGNAAAKEPEDEEAANTTKGTGSGPASSSGGPVAGPDGNFEARSVAMFQNIVRRLEAIVGYRHASGLQCDMRYSNADSLVQLKGMTNYGRGIAVVVGTCDARNYRILSGENEQSRAWEAAITNLGPVLSKAVEEHRPADEEAAKAACAAGRTDPSDASGTKPKARMFTGTSAIPPTKSSVLAALNKGGDKAGLIPLYKQLRVALYAQAEEPKKEHVHPLFATLEGQKFKRGAFGGGLDPEFVADATRITKLWQNAEQVPTLNEIRFLLHQYANDRIEALPSDSLLRQAAIRSSFQRPVPADNSPLRVATSGTLRLSAEQQAFVACMLRAGCCAWLVGAPHSGKTTVLQWAVKRAAETGLAPLVLNSDPSGKPEDEFIASLGKRSSLASQVIPKKIDHERLLAAGFLLDDAHALSDHQLVTLDWAIRVLEGRRLLAAEASPGELGRLLLPFAGKMLAMVSSSVPLATEITGATLAANSVPFRSPLLVEVAAGAEVSRWHTPVAQCGRCGSTNYHDAVRKDPMGLVSDIVTYARRRTIEEIQAITTRRIDTLSGASGCGCGCDEHDDCPVYPWVVMNAREVTLSGGANSYLLVCRPEAVANIHTSILESRLAATRVRLVAPCKGFAAGSIGTMPGAFVSSEETVMVLFDGAADSVHVPMSLLCLSYAASPLDLQGAVVRCKVMIALDTSCGIRTGLVRSVGQCYSLKLVEYLVKGSTEEDTVRQAIFDELLFGSPALEAYHRLYDRESPVSPPSPAAALTDRGNGCWIVPPRNGAQTGLTCVLVCIASGLRLHRLTTEVDEALKDGWRVIGGAIPALQAVFGVLLSLMHQRPDGWWDASSAGAHDALDFAMSMKQSLKSLANKQSWKTPNTPAFRDMANVLQHSALDTGTSIRRWTSMLLGQTLFECPDGCVCGPATSCTTVRDCLRHIGALLTFPVVERSNCKACAKGITKAGPPKRLHVTSSSGVTSALSSLLTEAKRVPKRCSCGATASVRHEVSGPAPAAVFMEVEEGIVDMASIPSFTILLPYEAEGNKQLTYWATAVLYSNGMNHTICDFVSDSGGGYRLQRFDDTLLQDVRCRTLYAADSLSDASSMLWSIMQYEQMREWRNKATECLQWKPVVLVYSKQLPSASDSGPAIDWKEATVEFRNTVLPRIPAAYFDPWCDGIGQQVRVGAAQPGTRSPSLVPTPFSPFGAPTWRVQPNDAAFRRLREALTMPARPTKEMLLDLEAATRASPYLWDVPQLTTAPREWLSEEVPRPEELELRQLFWNLQNLRWVEPGSSSSLRLGDLRALRDTGRVTSAALSHYLYLRKAAKTSARIVCYCRPVHLPPVVFSLQSGDVPRFIETAIDDLSAQLERTAGAWSQVDDVLCPVQVGTEWFAIVYSVKSKDGNLRCMLPAGKEEYAIILKAIATVLRDGVNSRLMTDSTYGRRRLVPGASMPEPTTFRMPAAVQDTSGVWVCIVAYGMHRGLEPRALEKFAPADALPWRLHVLLSLVQGEVADTSMSPNSGGSAFVDPIGALPTSDRPFPQTDLVNDVATETCGGLFPYYRHSIHDPPSPLSAAQGHRILQLANPRPNLRLCGRGMKFTVTASQLEELQPRQEVSEDVISLHMVRLNAMNGELLKGRRTRAPTSDTQLLDDTGVHHLVPCLAMSSDLTVWLTRNSLNEAIEQTTAECRQLANHRLLLIPWSVPGHWLLLVVDLEECKLHVYDSLWLIHPESVALVTMWLAAVVPSAGKPPGTWETVYHKAIAPKQRESVDCGIFTIAFARCISTGTPFDFCQGSMDTVRMRLLWETVQDHLTGRFVAVDV